MSYSWILITLVSTLMLSEMYFLGKYYSKVNDIFRTNEFATISAGSIIYFVITFFALFIARWFEPSILTYSVIFFIKEFFTISFLIIRRNVFTGIKVNYKSIAFSIVGGVTLPLLFNYGISNFETINQLKMSNDFQLIFKFEDIIQKITTLDIDHVKNWIMSIISGVVILSFVSSLVVRISRRKDLIDYLIAYVITAIMLIIFNFHIGMNYLIGLFSLIFAIQMGYEVILKSRRRYGVMFGLLVVNMWFFDPRLFLTFFILGNATIIIYGYLKKPRVSMFFVQMIFPFAIMASLWIHPYSSILALFVSIASVITYIFFISGSRIQKLNIFNDWLIKLRFIIPIFVFSVVLLSSILVGSLNHLNASEYLVFKDAVIPSFNNSNWDLIQTIVFNLSYGILFMIIMYWLIKEKNILTNRLLVLIAGGILLFGYNPYILVLVNQTPLSDQFEFLKFAAFAPLLILGLTRIRNIKKVDY